MNLNYVRFDVGHHLHLCHRNTIEKYPNSALARYIAPEFDLRKTGDDYILIDRDGKHFGSILNFMRDDSSLKLHEWTSGDLTDLLREADFYCLAELMDLCEHELLRRDTPTGSKEFAVPAHHKLEIIFGLSVMRQLLASLRKPTIVISQACAKTFNIESWFAELVQLCNHDRFNVYCFADRDGEARICDRGPALKNFIVALYEPKSSGLAFWVPSPQEEKFRSRRAHYKCKIFKFWFMIQNDMVQRLWRKNSQVAPR